MNASPRNEHPPGKHHEQPGCRYQTSHSTDEKKPLDVIEQSLFSQRLAAISDEMGSRLKRTAFSANIRDRLDYSCAVFDSEGKLAGQAAHIPVHLGSMACALLGLVSQFEWKSGKMLVFNDPYRGGTHLPDVTLVAPLFISGQLLGFVVNRAHHADIGAIVPGGMPLSSHIEQEGVFIKPQWITRGNKLDKQKIAVFSAGSCNPENEIGDYAAQFSANLYGLERLRTLIETLGIDKYFLALEKLYAYGERLSAATLSRLPAGRWQFTDYLDDDGSGNRNIPIKVTLKNANSRLVVDFAGTAKQVAGNVNCPLPVTTAAVHYVFRCLMPDYAPTCHGLFSGITIKAPQGTLVNARYPAAVAAGNVETSSRIVDCMLGAMGQAIPDSQVAASQGTMNNIAMGNATAKNPWAIYETIAGGCGAKNGIHGRAGTQSHMTNTLNTPIEELEMKYPLRILRYALRPGSGGSGRFRGGDGIIREYGFLSPTTVTVLSERRRLSPWGLAGGKAGAKGENRHNEKPLPGKVTFSACAGDVLRISTPGGGGYGETEPSTQGHPPHTTHKDATSSQK